MLVHKSPKWHKYSLP